MFKVHFIKYFLYRTIPAALNIVTIGIFTRLLSPSSYGMYALVAAVAGFLAVLSSFLPHSLLRLWNPSASVDEKKVLLSNVIALFLAAHLLSACLAGAILLLVPSETVNSKFLILVCTIFFTMSARQIVLDFNRARMTPDLFGLIVISTSVITIIFGSLFIYIGLDWIGVLIAVAIAELAPCIAYVKKGLSRLDMRLIDTREMGRIISYGAPIVAASSLYQVVYMGGRVILGATHGAAAVGVFSASYDLAQRVITVLMQTVNMAAMPLIFRAEDAGNFDRKKILLDRAFLLSLVVGFPPLLIVGLRPQEVSELVLGSEYIGGSVIVMPLVALGVFIARLKSNFFDVPMLLAKKTVLQLVANGSAAAIMVTLGAAIITAFGAPGAAFASVLSYSAALSVSWLVVRKRFQLSVPFANSMPIVMSAIAGAAVVLWAPQAIGSGSLLVDIAFAGAAFTTVLLVLNGLGIRDYTLKLIRGRFGPIR